MKHRSDTVQHFDRDVQTIKMFYFTRMGCIFQLRNISTVSKDKCLQKILNCKKGLLHNFLEVNHIFCLHRWIIYILKDLLKRNLRERPLHFKDVLVSFILQKYRYSLIDSSWNLRLETLVNILFFQQHYIMNSLPQADLQLHLASSYHVQEHKIHSNYETYILSS